MSFKSVKNEQPYQAIAFIYHHVMKHINYSEWAEYINSLCLHYQHPIENVLEMACGIGTFTSYLAEYGYEILAVDNSETMIRLAKEMNTSPRITFKVGDMRSFTSKRKFDTILCIYDSVNYLISKEDLALAIKMMGDCLQPRGLLIFDVTTVTNSLTNFDHTQEIEETTDFLYWRRSKYLRREKLQINDFTIFLKDGNVYRRFHEKHQQRIYTFQTVKAAIKNAGLEPIGRFHDFTFDPPEKHSLRIHYVAQKPLYK